ncbi:putative very-long-chain 3-oxoacyl-CoA reductase [Helianthus annuus]|nr:putative very-long-chain 3-oxoacyl-CoA reductase [Helianthus annuus]
MPLLIACKGKSGFSAKNTAEDVTEGIDGHGLTAIITVFFFFLISYVFISSIYIFWDFLVILLQ